MVKRKQEGNKFMRTKWSNISNYLLAFPFGKKFWVRKSEAEHPSELNFFQKAMGVPQGEIAHWRAFLPHNMSLHVIEYLEGYLVHLDRIDPRKNLTGHLREDAPGWYITLLTSGITGAAYLLGGRKSIAQGAFIGLLSSILTLPSHPISGKQEK